MPTAVVTGANSGIAKAFASILREEGYKVYAVDRDNGDGLKALSSAGAHTSQLDVTSTESIASFKASLGDEHIDLLLNIAGIAFPIKQDSLETVTLSTFEKTFAVNTYGPLFLIQALLPNVLASKGKKIGIVTSRVGSISDNSTSGSYAYRASKTAANQIGRNLSIDLRPHGVTVLLLHPGIVNTNILSGMDIPKEAVEPEEAARKLWKNVVESKGLEDGSGRFWHREGWEIPW